MKIEGSYICQYVHVRLPCCPLMGVQIRQDQTVDLILPYTDVCIARVSVEKPTTSCLLVQTSSKQVVGSNPARVTCECFFYKHSESTEHTVLHTCRCRAKLNQLFMT